MGNLGLLQFTGFYLDKTTNPDSVHSTVFIVCVHDRTCRNPDIYSENGVVHVSPGLVQIRSGLLHFWWKQASYQTSSLSPQQPLAISLWDDQVWVVLFYTWKCQLHPGCPSPSGIFSSHCSSWVSFGTSGYPFMAPISLTHVQVQYWLALSPDNISI